ncbi:MAG: hypothetical protein HYW45_03380 [Candidatus Daviesbacteria bacterium]|nr:MAG: hypothetical protein HYW45_03380 [Candidatus Daviesbacteria bacterium]
MLDSEPHTSSIVLPPANEKAVLTASSLADREVEERVLYQMLRFNPHLFWYLNRVAMIMGIISDSQILSADAYLQGAGRYFHALTITAANEGLTIPRLDVGHALTYAKAEGTVERADNGIRSISVSDYLYTIAPKRELTRPDFLGKELEMVRELERMRPAFILACDDYSAVEGGMLDIYGILQNYYFAQKAAAMFNKEVR